MAGLENLSLNDLKKCSAYGLYTNLQDPKLLEGISGINYIGQTGRKEILEETECRVKISLKEDNKIFYTIAEKILNSGSKILAYLDGNPILFENKNGIIKDLSVTINAVSSITES